jgi:hypothetical protein
VAQATGADTLARQIAFHLRLAAIFACSPELRCISGIRTAIGLCKHWDRFKRKGGTIRKDKRSKWSLPNKKWMILWPAFDIGEKAK